MGKATILDVASGVLSTDPVPEGEEGPPEIPASRALELLDHEAESLTPALPVTRITWYETNRASLEASGRLPGQQVPGAPAAVRVGPDEVVSGQGAPTGVTDTATLASEPVATPVASALAELTKGELQDRAAVLGLDTEGTKAEIAARIEESEAATEPTPA